MARIDPARNAVVADAEDRQPPAGPGRRRRRAVGERPRDRRAAPRRHAARPAHQPPPTASQTDRRAPGSGARLRRMGPLPPDQRRARGLPARRRAAGRARSSPISRCRCRRRPTVAAPTRSGCAAGCAIRRARPCTRPTSAAGSERVLRVNGGRRRVLHRDPWRPALRWSGRARLRPVLRHRGRRRRGHDHLPPDRARPGLPLQAGAAQRRRGRSRRGRRPARRPVPATGPYMVAGLGAHGPLRLVRNPRFRPVDGRPDGYPDAITIDCCADRQRAFARWSRDARTSSAADFGLTPSCAARSTRSRRATPASCTATPTAANELRVPEHAARPRSTTSTCAAPLNYAVDRRAFVAVYGGERYAQATCQFLPAELPRPPALLPVHGQRRWRPAVERPRSRARPAPDRPLAHARDARDRGRAAPLSLNRRSRLLVDAARPAGIPGHAARAARWSDYFSYIAGLASPRADRPGAWLPDYPSASNMLQTRCAATRSSRRRPSRANFSEFCDRRADAARTARLPAAGGRCPAPTRCGRRPTSGSPTRPPCVPLVNPKSIAFVSRRVGNFQYSQQWGVLYDQLWVR